ncbi:MAG: LysR substrate-binding domain-containing protein [Gammaproteobacteria bacterium]|jgi:LysR family hydrogen peroxide-inducible transcriptional activator
MNLRDLEYLVAVSENLHFGKAAARCFVSQPTLSGQIHKLEDELGFVLFERTNRSVHVTPIGQKVVAHARQILEQAQAIRSLSSEQKDPLAGPLRIGAIHTLSPYLVPLFMIQLTEAHPELSLELTEATTDQLLSQLNDHQIDGALLATAPPDDDLKEIRLFREPFWLAHPRDHVLYEKDEITLEDLKDERILLLSQEHCLTEQVTSACRIANRGLAGTVPRLNASSLDTLVQLVGMGLGVTLVPALSVHGGRLAADGVVLREVEIPDAYREIRLVYRSSFPRLSALKLFADIVCDVLPNTVN